MNFHTDGYTIGGNPSRVGGGFTIFRGENHIDQQLFMTKRILKQGFTNNEAELLGVHYSAIYAKTGDTIITDSMVVVAWVRSGRSKARPDLDWLCDFTRDLVLEKKLNLVHKPRDFNAAGRYNEGVYQA